MTAIAEKQRVRAPLASAARVIRAFLAAHPGPAGAARVELHAHDLHYPAVITLTPAHRPGDMTPRFEVHWASEGADSHSSFDGALLVGADEDYDAFTLRLDGRYEPPTEIAAETARALLVDMAHEIEAQIGREEAAKRFAFRPQ